MLRRLRDKIILFVFSKLVPLSWLDGYKTSISRIATIISAALTIGAAQFPEYIDFISEANAAILTVLGLVGIEIGKIHKEVKDKL